MNSNLPERFFDLDYYPTITEEEVKSDSYFKFPLTEIAGLGVAFSSLPEVFRTATQSVNLKNMYYAVKPENTQMIAAHDFGFLGSCFDSGGHLKGQARFIDVGSVEQVATVPFNPSFIFIAAMLMQIEHKLDTIEGIQKEILTFLNRDKQTKLEGDLKTLVDIINNYKYNWDNETYKKNNHKQAGDIKKEAQQNILFYRKSITEALNKKKGILVESKMKEKMERLQSDFKYYQLSVYLYGFASFLEVLLLGNYKSDYVNNVKSLIEDASYNYRLLYTKAYDRIEQLSSKTMEAHVLDGFATVNKVMGETIAKIPVIEKTPVDEALINVSEKIDSIGEKTKYNRLNLFDDNRDSGVNMFVDNCEMLDMLFNKPRLMLVDDENVYVKPLETV